MECYLDFEYDGQYLSDYGFVICEFDSASGTVASDAGSKITFSKVQRNYGRDSSLVSTRYNECIRATFDICKNPDLYIEQEERKITNDEYRDIMRWLNRREFLKFYVFGDDDDGKDACYFNASFNIEKLKIEGELLGLRLTMESDRPFGYGQERFVSWDFNDSSEIRTLNDSSDEIGYSYPDVTITCKEAGDITVSNDFENCNMLIRNCSEGEIITINGEAQIISTSDSSHDIANDFNYEFLKIGNTYDSHLNVISVSKPCKISIRYTPIIKDTP